MSGGRSTVAAKKDKKLAAQAGDVSCVNSIGSSLTNRFLIEIKFYKELDFENLMFGTGKLLKFWKELYKNATFYKKIPMLIAKENRSKRIICTNKLGIHFLKAKNYIALKIPPLDMNILLLDKFLENKYGTTRLLYYDYGKALRDFYVHKKGAQCRNIDFRLRPTKPGGRQRPMRRLPAQLPVPPMC